MSSSEGTPPVEPPLFGPGELIRFEAYAEELSVWDELFLFEDAQRSLRERFERGGPWPTVETGDVAGLRVAA